MFNYCSNLSDIRPLEKWDVSNCIDFSSMFYGCKSLSDLKPLEAWKIQNKVIYNENPSSSDFNIVAINFYHMFGSCTSL